MTLFPEAPQSNQEDGVLIRTTRMFTKTQSNFSEIGREVLSMCPKIDFWITKYLLIPNSLTHFIFQESRGKYYCTFILGNFKKFYFYLLWIFCVFMSGWSVYRHVSREHEGQRTTCVIPQAPPFLLETGCHWPRTHQGGRLAPIYCVLLLLFWLLFLFLFKPM